MTTFRRGIVGLFSLPAAVLWFAGCAGAPARNCERIGTLQVIGPNVYHNGAPARDGEDVCEDDSVSTGEDSSAIVRLVGDRTIQLDENTDPRFRFEVTEEDGRRCVHIEIKIGRVWVDGDVVCFETPDATGVLDSAVNIDVREATTVTVVAGKVLLTGATRQSLEAGQQATIADGRIVSVLRLDESQLREVVRWRQEFREPREELRGWCCVERRRVRAVNEATEAECTRARGKYFEREEEARDACAVESEERERFSVPATRRGYCCTGRGTVEAMTQTQCTLAKGSLYRTKEEAEKDRRCSIQ